jgi:hypothetical protein
MAAVAAKVEAVAKAEAVVEEFTLAEAEGEVLESVVVVKVVADREAVST